MKIKAHRQCAKEAAENLKYLAVKVQKSRKSCKRIKSINTQSICPLKQSLKGRKKASNQTDQSH